MSAAVEFAVLAPVPERVRLQVDGSVHDMRREEGGWWRAEVEAAPDADYGFLLGDDGPDQQAQCRQDDRADDAHGAPGRRGGALRTGGSAR